MPWLRFQKFSPFISHVNCASWPIVTCFNHYWFSASLKALLGGIPIDTGLVTSAIRACWGSSRYSDKAARYFYNLFGELGLTPTIVTFTTLAGALQSAPLEDVLWIYKEMQASQIVPDRVFAETYLISLLSVGRLARDPERLAQEHLRYKPPEHLDAARYALNDFKSQGVELSALCRKVGKALSMLGF